MKSTSSRANDAGCYVLSIHANSQRTDQDYPNISNCDLSLDSEELCCQSRPLNAPVMTCKIKSIGVV